VPALANRPALSREYFLATKKLSQRVLTELSFVLPLLRLFDRASQLGAADHLADAISGA
jgi:hypothetical protein